MKIEEEESDKLTESDLSDLSEYAENYDLHFHLSDKEIDGLREAFDDLKDLDNKISFFELFRKLE